MERNSLIALQRAYLKPFSLQSEFARTNMTTVCELASRGLITTHVGGGFYGRIWRVTPAGRALLEYTQGDNT